MFPLCSREISKGRVVYMLLAVILSVGTLQWWLEFSYSDEEYMWKVVGDRKNASRIWASHGRGWCTSVILLPFSNFPEAVDASFG